MKVFLIGLLLFSFGTAYGKSYYSLAQPPLAAPAVSNSRTATPVSDDSSPVRLTMGPSVGFLNGVQGYGGTVDLSFSTGTPVYIGVESGYFGWTQNSTDSSGNSTANNLTSIPVLATVVYRFGAKQDTFHPYLGFGAGISVTSGTLSTTTNGTPSSNTANSIDFEVVAKPGVDLSLSKTTSIFMEPKVGLLRDQFLFQPQIGIAFVF